MDKTHDVSDTQNRLRVLMAKCQYAAQELGYLRMIGAELEEYGYVVYRHELITPSDPQGFVSKEEVDEFKRLSAQAY